VPEDDISVMLMSDWGLDLYGNAVIVNPEFAAANPEAVTGFIAATIRGLKDAIADPAAGAAAVVAHNDVVTVDVEQERLELALASNMITDDVRANGFGGIDPDRFARGIEQIALTYTFTNPLPGPDDIFDSSFLPPAAERMIE